MKNFKINKKEKPFYYATTFENGKIVEHEGDEKYAVYESEIKESSRRADLYHEWVNKNYKNAYDVLGKIDDNIYTKTSEIRRAFLDGERIN